MNFKNLSILFVLMMAGNASATMTRANSNPALPSFKATELQRTVSAPAVLYTEVNVSNIAGNTITVQVEAGIEGVDRKRLLRKSVATAIGEELFRTHVVESELGATYLVNPLNLVFLTGCLEDPNTGIVHGTIGLPLNDFIICFRVNYLQDETEAAFAYRINGFTRLSDLLAVSTHKATISNRLGNPAIVLSTNDVIRFLNEASFADNPPNTADETVGFLKTLGIQSDLNSGGVSVALFD